MVCLIHSSHNVTIFSYSRLLHCFTLPVLLFCHHKLCCVFCSNKCYVRLMSPYLYQKLASMTVSGLSFLDVFYFSSHFVRNSFLWTLCTTDAGVFFPQQHFTQLNTDSKCPVTSGILYWETVHPEVVELDPLLVTNYQYTAPCYICSNSWNHKPGTLWCHTCLAHRAHIQRASVNRAILQHRFFLVRQHRGGYCYRHFSANFKAF